MEINPSELRVDTFRTGASNWVNEPLKGVRITHLPSGRIFESTDKRSQHANRAEAYKLLEQFLTTYEPTKKGNNMQRALSIGEFLKLPNAYVISVDDVNIGHTAVIEDVSQDNIHFVGVDEIVTFTHKTMFTENLYVFNTKSPLYVTKDNYSGKPYCQHLYNLEDIGGQKVQIELGFVTTLYQMEKLNAKNT